jgi:GAF domain-containing protein
MDRSAPRAGRWRPRSTIGLATPMSRLVATFGVEVVVTRETVLARTMVELADNLVDDFDIVDLLTTLSDRCVEVLDIAAAGIMLAAPDGHLRAMTSSSEAMRIVELFELQSQEGPCLDCFRTGEPVVNQDLTTVNGRWPRFAPVAVEAGFMAADAIPMRLRGQVIGALNLFRTETGSLTADDVAVAQALADIATIAILQNRVTVETKVLNEQLAFALSSRIVIEQAKGMIAERQQVPVDQAFERLRRHARNHNVRLADLARRTVNGDVDPTTFGPPGT